MGLLPSTLTHLEFGSRFQQRLPPNALPTAITSLSFGWRPGCFGQYNHAFNAGELPPSLLDLALGQHYTHALSGGVLPPTVTRLQLCADYYDPDFDLSQCTGLTDLLYQHSSDDYDLPSASCWPNSLRILRLGWFKPLIPPNVLPNNLTSITFPHEYRQPLLPHALPNSLTELNLDKTYGDTLLPRGVIPRTDALITLRLGYTRVDEQLPSSLC